MRKLSSWIKGLVGLSVLVVLPMLAVGHATGQVPLKQIKVGTINIITYSPIYIAKEMGYFKDEGLDVDLFETNNGAALNAALLGGSVVATAAGYNQPLLVAEQGKSLKSVVGMEMASCYVFIVNPTLNIPKDDPAAMAKALKGKRFGVASIGSTGHMIAEGLLAEYGVSSKDVTFVAVGTGASALAAMKSGAVDAVNPSEPDVTQIVESGVGTIALDLRNTKSEQKFSTLPTSTIQVTSAWLEKNPETAAAIVRAIVKANDTLRNDANASLRVFAKLYPNMPAESIGKAYSYSKVNFKSEISENQFINAQKIYRQVGQIKTSVPYESVVATQFRSLW